MHLRHSLCALLLSAPAAVSAAGAAGGDRPRGRSAEAGTGPTQALPQCGFNLYPHTACTANPYRTLPNVTLAVCCQTCTDDNQCAGFTLHAGRDVDLPQAGQSSTASTGSCLMSLGSGIKNPNHKAKGITCGTRSPLPGPSPAPAPGGDNVPLDFDCGARRLALGYSGRVLSGATGQAGSVFEALQLGPKCGDHPPPAAVPTAADPGDRLGSVSYFVSPTGSDSAAGKATAPWRTLGRVLVALAQRPASARPATFVNLLPGTYRLNETLLVTAAHSGVRFCHIFDHFVTFFHHFVTSFHDLFFAVQHGRPGCLAPRPRASHRRPGHYQRWRRPQLTHVAPLGQGV